MVSSPASTDRVTPLEWLAGAAFAGATLIVTAFVQLIRWNARD